MEDVLWYLLASSRGGPTRTRILRAIEERPRNANQLATALDLDYTTVRHHLEVLCENNVLRKSGDEYAAVYLYTERADHHRDTIDEVLDAVEPVEESTEESTGRASTDGSAEESTERASTDDPTEESTERVSTDDPTEESTERASTDDPTEESTDESPGDGEP